MRSYETFHSSYETLAVHRHGAPFLALVLEGEYEERSVDGRYLIGPGNLVLHPPFHAHCNRFLSKQVRVLNLEIEDPNLVDDDYKVATVPDADVVAKLMLDRPRDVCGLAGEIFGHRRDMPQPMRPWLREFSLALSQDQNGDRIQALAADLGISFEHASRQFKREFGISPISFRREQQVRRAVQCLREGATLSAAAVDAGFADQSHMGRVFKSVFGLTPAVVQRQALR